MNFTKTELVFLLMSMKHIKLKQKKYNIIKEIITEKEIDILILKIKNVFKNTEEINN